MESIKIEPMETDGGNKKLGSTSASTSGATEDKKPLVTTGKKIFTKEELIDALLPIWAKLESVEDAIPFREPVDPILLGIPDYFDVIKNPMDLSTIREKLVEGIYKDPWEFCDDMWLMFENAWLYNRKASRVYKYCTKLSEMFVDLIDPAMRSLGFCCGRKLSFSPLALACYGQNLCAIPRDAIYYLYEDNKSQFGVGSERYTYCKKCFDEIPGDVINVADDATSDNMIPKKNFKQLKNDHIDYEPFFHCVDCGRKWHQICGLHMDQIYPGGFVCEGCVKTRGKKKTENRYVAKRLPHCKLSQHLEKRVNEFLKTKVPPDQAAGEVVIRVLSSSDKEVEVKSHMKSKFCGPEKENFPEKFPYKAKAIFAFQVIDGVEVCFFGLHVQEFGTSCSPPNQRRVYIAYLDSVHFFHPRLFRTQVYHEILLGYLEYVKKLGYTMAHIWACPPSEGDDYIFHCHPPEQKIPKPKRLQEWYKKMLDRGIVERVVTDYKDIYEFYQKEEILTSITELPFFEGDYWPNVVEECIKDVEKEEAERRRHEEAQAAAGGMMDDLEDDADEIFGGGKKRNANGHKKNKSKNKNANYKKSKKGGAGTGNDLTDKIMTALEKHKEVFFVVRLYSKQSAAALPAITDPDSHIQCDFMDGRDTFLSTARDRHWEFSSLRRAKFSTMALCYELHTQGSDKFIYTCNTCKNQNPTWHCAECEDYDLCQECYEKTQHEHKMERIKSIVGDEATSSQDQGAQARDRTEPIQRCIQTLVHASQCRDANCRRISCKKMKRVVQHVKSCKNWQSSAGQNACSVCRQLLSLCVFHAKHCQEQACSVPFCQNIRQKLAERQNQLKKKREREMMRRINLMSNQQQQQQQQGPSSVAGQQPSTPYQQQTASPIPSMNIGGPPQMGGPGGGMMSGQSSYQQHQMQQPVNPAAIRAARNIELIAQQQSQQFGTAGMPGQFQPRMRHPGPGPGQGVPPGMGPMPPPQQQQQQSQQPQHWEGGGKPRSFPSHYGMQQGGAGGSGQGPSGPPSGPSGAGGNPNQNPLYQQVQIVLSRLKNATTQDERNQIMLAVRSDPQLFATIIRMKQQPQQQPQPLQPPQHQNFNGPAMPNQQIHPQQQQQQQYFNPNPRGPGPGAGMMMSQGAAPPNYQRMPMYGNGPQGKMPQQGQQQSHFMHQQQLEQELGPPNDQKFH